MTPPPPGASAGALTVPGKAAPPAVAGLTVPGWSLEVAAGPNQGAVVPLEADARLGSGLGNDVVLADPAIADEQALFILEGERCVLDVLAAGIAVNGKPAPAGRFVVLRDGLLLQAGATTIRVHGPAPKPKRARLLLFAIPAMFAAVGIGSLVGIASPGRTGPVPPPSVATPALPPPSADAADALRARLRDAGLADQIQVTTSTGAVIAEGQVSGPMMARWKEQQPWFDSRYKGTLSLVNRVREATPDEKPDISVASVWSGNFPYFITASGDRYVVGSVVKGWTVEEIAADKIVLSRSGKRYQYDL